MNKTTSKVIQISDLVQWNAKGVIELSPKYQRNNVWNDNAKAYLIDTIIRGLPIPPIFLREKIDVYTKTTNREIIDGQQRVRAILEYVVDEKFTIKNSHNKEYGGKKYSDLDENSKEAILGFEIIAEVVVEKDESVIYDMFARLNSNNYVLNKQEIRNAKYWGDFKVLIYSIAAEYRDFFLRYGIFSDKECTRMKDVELVNSLVILLNEGIVEETPAFVNKIYNFYDKEFPEGNNIENKIADVMKKIEEIYDYFKGNLGCLNNKNYFYTLFAVLYNQFYGIKNLDLIKSEELKNINNLKDIIANFLNDYIKVSDDSGMEQSEIRDWAEFKKNHKIRTTSKNERTSRISFLNSYFMR
ncbi:DUF262 domain-containing protein [Gemella morbillorum]|uniref:DUF262 domain-containing protein n=1 Tax=Gemella morbillorum TaxID=29391 RepID=UPI0028D6A5BB|nr:DUF262 domain-containing protein [Gemella morbillorum]